MTRKRKQKSTAAPGLEYGSDTDLARIVEQVNHAQQHGFAHSPRGQGEGGKGGEDEDQSPQQQQHPRKRRRGAARDEARALGHEEHDSGALFHPHALAHFHDLPAELRKYFHSRYELFSLYDHGISLDATSWFSVTPESIAARIAERCRSNTILDAFAGAGGNAIQFAKVCERVVAVEIDPVKVELARHNARIYGVADRITFVTGDVRDFADAHRRAHEQDRNDISDADPDRWLGAEQLDFDVVFLSPPWGGVTYLQSNAQTDPPAPKDPVPNSRERRLARRQKKRLGGQGFSVQSEQTQDDGFDLSLAAQLGLPLAFTGRTTGTEQALNTEDGDEYEEHYQEYDVEEADDDDQLHAAHQGDVTATPWTSSAGHADDTAAKAASPAANAYSLSRLEPIPGPELMALARSLCASTPEANGAPSKTGGNNIALYLPRNIDLDELAALGRVPRDRPAQPGRRSPPSRRPAPITLERASSEDDTDSVSEMSTDDSPARRRTSHSRRRQRRRHDGEADEGPSPIHLEECWLSGRLKAVCAYFGELASAWDAERDGWR